MNITFEQDNQIFYMRVHRRDMLHPDNGYRNGNEIVLGENLFKMWHKALMADDFAMMRRIVDLVTPMQYAMALKAPVKMLH